MMQNLIVALMVSAAAFYVAVKYTPAALRSRLGPKLARVCMRLHLPAALARRLEQKVTSAGACGSCNSCNACATDPVSAPEGSALRVIPIKSTR